MDRRVVVRISYKPLFVGTCTYPTFGILIGVNNFMDVTVLFERFNVKQCKYA